MGLRRHDQRSDSPRAGWGAGHRGKRGSYADGGGAARWGAPPEGAERDSAEPMEPEAAERGRERAERGERRRSGGAERGEHAERAEHRFEAADRGGAERPGRGARRYPWEEDPDYEQPRSRSRRLPPLPEDHSSQEQDEEPEVEKPRGTAPPKKLTVTRVAAWRSRDLTQRAMRMFFSLAHADGADRSGLAKFTYAVMGNYAVDAAMAVALANTLFFSAATGESKDKVALYLLITVAPFAVIAPVIGPALDRLQQGRRYALAASFAVRVLLAAVMALNFDSWLLYPAALGCMVLSKSFGVLKAAMTPRVLPSQITLTKANSRLTAFGMAAGGIFGAIASGFAYLLGSEGALWFMAAMAAGGVWLCLRMPGWVESTEGEVPASIGGRPQPKKVPLSGHVVVALWGNGGIRVLTGFLTLFAAFVIKQSTQHEPFMQLVQLGMVGGAAGIGSFLGNALGSKMHFGKPDRVIIACLGSALVVAVCAAVLAGLPLAVVVGLIAATASALAKVCLDAVIQHDMPEESRASAFGKSETILQLSWVFGGALGVLLPPVYWIGFAVVAALLALVLAQTITAGRGGTLVPQLRRKAAPAAERAAAKS
ncbi:Predicted arabinose efflux permease, MFS family [Saccharopolyspora antimicrobica]|uniref:MFS family arabinose efflux permease n=1 Tax=Saccharopolyspora antimicrobica TaxID=455193 RepID=A0A1I5IW02_9PSEU|nr:MFS transporter [Saccharopolyspora antimicrobica]RKT83732.1 putative MFS family arabinose efflux permease [Saccharopolyspora antimicrobica]SFO64697.1 Predicted arabinose efflux permease, MFS family [Saccharopolyspora antimicrobica]